MLSRSFSLIQSLQRIELACVKKRRLTLVSNWYLLMAFAGDFCWAVIQYSYDIPRIAS